MFSENDFFDMYDFLIDYEIATENEIAIACYFNGRTADTLNDLLFFKTGNRDKEQYLSEIGGYYE